MSNSRSVNVNWPLPSLLTVLFVGLKLTGHITWSWWWVLSPLWIPAVGVLVFLIIAFIIAMIIALVASRTR